MLPDIELDQQSFEEIVEDAKKQIAKVYPRWTNYNEADPGITFLELFSWLKEMQQYHLNQIGEKNQRKFLKLLGVWPAPMEPAKALLHLWQVEKDTTLLQREQFCADTIPFETTNLHQLVKAKLMVLQSHFSKEKREFWLSHWDQGAEFYFLPFGTEPCVGNHFCMAFDSPLPVQISFSLYVCVFQNYPVQRNKIREDSPFYPLAKLRWEYWTASGWKQAKVLKDESHEFLQNGFVELQLQEPMTQGQEGFFWLRVVLEENWYEIPVVFTGIYTNMLPVVQCNTLADYQDFAVEGQTHLQIPLNHRLGKDVKFLAKKQDGYKKIQAPSMVQTFQEDGTWLAQLELEEDTKEVRALYQDVHYSAYLQLAIGNGFPKQKYQIKMDNILSSHLEIMVEEADGLWHCWQQVKDFDASFPESRHFCFEESSGMVSFGDCEHGMAPVGPVYLVRAVASEGIDGNVKQQQISTCLRKLPVAHISNHWVAAGGKQPETLQECFMRARASLRQCKRAVTDEDYQQQVKNAPGLMIQNCRCVSSAQLYQGEVAGEENTVHIVVQPFSKEKREKLNEGYYRNLYALLDRCRLMGTKVRVLSPEYIGITIFAEIRIRPYYQQAHQMIQKTVEDFFDTAKWVFGNPVQYSTLYGVIDRLECVLSVDSLAIDAKGANISRNRSGDVLLPPNGLVYLNSAQYHLSDGE